MTRILMQAFTALMVLTPSVAHAFCFTEKYDRGSPYLERLTRKARALPKKRDTYIGLVDSDQSTKISTFQKWFVKELNADSLLTQQLLPIINESVIQNGRASSYLDTYLNGDGVECERLLFAEKDLSVESVKILEERKGSSTIGDDGYAIAPATISELVVVVNVAEPGRDDDNVHAEKFSIRVKTDHYPSGQDNVHLLSYPQWIGEKW
jgi:hypothetical protein